MTLLLDTHAILWVLSDDPRLSRKARRVYEETGGVFFSVVSLWEIGVKLGLRRADFQLDINWWRDIPQSLVAQGVRRLDVEPEHCRTVAELPLHHRDPFDRMLVAQAMSTHSRVLSIDDKLDEYDIRRVW